MKESTIFSIGHGNKTIERFIDELRSFDISYLADVRTKPYSKWNADFNRETLQGFLAAAGIRYVYMGDAIGGLPSDSTCYTRGHIDYGKMAQQPSFIAGLERVVTAGNNGIRLCLMCSESDPAMCHRSKLIGVELLKRGIMMRHIVAAGKAKTQYDVIYSLTKGEGLIDLFGEETTLMSRKDYT